MLVVGEGGKATATRPTGSARQPLRVSGGGEGGRRVGPQAEGGRRGKGDADADAHGGGGVKDDGKETCTANGDTTRQPGRSRGGVGSGRGEGGDDVNGTGRAFDGQ